MPTLRHSSHAWTPCMAAASLDSGEFLAPQHVQFIQHLHFLEGVASSAQSSAWHHHGSETGTELCDKKICDDKTVYVYPNCAMLLRSDEHMVCLQKQMRAEVSGAARVFAFDLTGPCSVLAVHVTSGHCRTLQQSQ